MLAALWHIHSGEVPTLLVATIRMQGTTGCCYKMHSNRYPISGYTQTLLSHLRTSQSHRIPNPNNTSVTLTSNKDDYRLWDLMWSNLEDMYRRFTITWSRIVWNVDIYLPNYTMSHVGKRLSSQSLHTVHLRPHLYNLEATILNVI